VTEYARDGNRLTTTRRFNLADGTPYVVTLAAREIRRERTGIHARVDVVVNGVTLAYSTFNVEKDEDRVRLGNSAFKQYSQNGLAVDYPATFLKKDLDLFCDGLWDEQMAVMMPEPMVGVAVRAPPSFLLRPYILKDSGTLIFAPPGRGKSFILLCMAVSLDAGLSVIWPVEQTPVLFVNLERAKRSVEARLGNVNAVLGVSRERPLHTLNARGRGFLDVLEPVQRYVTEHRIGCVFLDSLSRAGMGDLNENQPANKIIDALNELGTAWLALAHTPRNDPSHIYGSMHFEAGADILVRQLSQQDSHEAPLGIGLDLDKANDIPKFPMRILALEFDAAGLTGLRPAKVGEFPEVEGGGKVSLAHEVREYLLQVGASTATQIAKALGRNRSNLSGLLVRDHQFAAIARKQNQVYYGVRGEG